MGSRLESKSSQVRKRIEDHSFDDEAGEEYEPSRFGGFGEYFRRKKIKLQNLDADMRASSADKPQIFKGVVAHVTGFTQPPLHVLHKELVQHGAGFLQYLDGKTMATHIIASTMTPKKAIEYARYRIVKPAWVVDSIAAGKMLPWNDYRVVDEGARQKVLAFGEGSMLTQATPKRSVGYSEQIENSFYLSQFKSQAAGQSAGSNDRSERQTTPTMAPPPSAQPLTETQASESFSGGVDDSLFDEIVLDTPTKPVADKTPQLESRSPVMETPTKPAPSAATEAGHDASPTDTSPARSECRTDLKMPENMTSEEHNAWLLSDPRIRKSSTANPEFLKQYYSESRLHHLSTWKAELKSRMQRLAKEKEKTVKVAKRKPGARRYILHVDFDSFFCAVSLMKHPDLVDKPVVVAHSPGVGSEIASCNYPARKFGVKNGMWMKRALELCPDIKVVPYDFPAYEEASRLFYEAILEIGGIVQSVSVDEALMDVTSIIYDTVGSTGGGVDEGSLWREQEAADAIARKLRDDIKSRTGCAVSVGIGGNILQAKVALRRAKPAGQYQLKPEEVLGMLGELEVKDLPGVAHSISGKLEEIGIKFIKDIRQVSREKLTSTLGPRTGEKLWEYARGIDRTEVGEQSPRKSVSAEVNWGIRFINQPEAEEFVMNLGKELERRLLNEQVKGKQLTFKIMRRSLDAPLDPAKHLGHGKCDTFNKSTMFGVATNNAETIGKEAVAILRSFKFSPGDLRGLGLQLTKLDPMRSGASAVESSQRRLAFPTFSAPRSARKHQLESIDEDQSSEVDSPTAKKAKRDDIVDARSPPKRRRSSDHDVAQDPITDDPLTPRKPKAVHPALAIARAGENDARATSTLNIAGTQFILPSNADPAVLAELPNDIRSKLQLRPSPSPFVRVASPGPSRSEAPAAPSEPLPPGIDPEVFNALPDDMKAEVLAEYRQPAQPAPPPSPPPQRMIPPVRIRTPTRRGGGRGSRGRARERAQDAAARRMQTSLAPLRLNGTPIPDVPDELDPAFLAELPEDVRREVVEDHERKLIAKKAGRTMLAPRRRFRTAGLSTAPRGLAKVLFPAAPAKVPFSGATAAGDVRDMLEAWHEQTKGEGPHEDDVEVFGRYLAKVVVEERDVNKGVKLVEWAAMLVKADTAQGEDKEAWNEALDEIKAAVQDALAKRGLGPVRF